MLTVRNALIDSMHVINFHWYALVTLMFDWLKPFDFDQFEKIKVKTNLQLSSPCEEKSLSSFYLKHPASYLNLGSGHAVR